MIKDIIKEHPRKCRIWLFCLFTLLLAAMIPFYSYWNTAKKNEKTAEKILASIDHDKNISYVSIEQLEQLLELKYIPDKTIGKTYRLMAEISFLSNDKSAYNLYVAHAVYYFKKAQCQEEIIALYSEYLGRLYENAGFDAAKEFLDRQYKYLTASGDKNKEAMVSYYLNYADVEQMRGDYVSTKEKLTLAMDSLKSIPQHPHYQRLLAKYHILNARMKLLLGNVKAAQKELSGYHADDNLGLPEGNLYVYCDFILPYHEMMGKIALLQKKENEAIPHINFYLKGCNESSFYMMEYRMLQFIMEHGHLLSEEHFQTFQKQFAALSDHNLRDLANRYSSILRDSLDQVQGTLQTQDERANDRHVILIITLVLLYTIIFFSALLNFLLLYFHTDALTRLTVRSCYEKKRSSMERRKIPYYLLILDIDDFKKINDTYGHASGDLVLKQLAVLIKEALPAHDTAYRYGGEEICIILKDNKEEAFAISKKICTSIHHFAWNRLIPQLHTPITISGGLAEAKHGKNPFREADRSLYYSKRHGKNQITYYADINNSTSHEISR